MELAMNTSVELGAKGLVAGNLFSVTAEWAGTVECVIFDGVYEVSWTPRLHCSKFAKSWRKSSPRSKRSRRGPSRGGRSAEGIVAEDTMKAVNKAYEE